jgi:hypothetical protein
MAWCACQGLNSARGFPGVLLDMLVGWIAPLVFWGFTAMFDRIARRCEDVAWEVKACSCCIALGDSLGQWEGSEWGAAAQT